MSFGRTHSVVSIEKSNFSSKKVEAEFFDHSGPYENALL